MKKIAIALSILFAVLFSFSSALAQEDKKEPCKEGEPCAEDGGTGVAVTATASLTDPSICDKDWHGPADPYDCAEGGAFCRCCECLKGYYPDGTGGCLKAPDCPSGYRWSDSRKKCVEKKKKKEIKEDSRCGDGTKDEGEECDFGSENGKAGIPCNRLCQEKWCGDGTTDPDEDCDEGNRNGTPGATCTKTCKHNFFCGDQVVDPQKEECDDGNMSINDGCNAECKEEYCGDGVRQAVRKDDSNLNEECDEGDKNGLPGSKCSNECKLIEAPEPEEEDEKKEAKYPTDWIFRVLGGAEILFPLEGEHDTTIFVKTNFVVSKHILNSGWFGSIILEAGAHVEKHVVAEGGGGAELGYSVIPGHSLTLGALATAVQGQTKDEEETPTFFRAYSKVAYRFDDINELDLDDSGLSFELAMTMPFHCKEDRGWGFGIWAAVGGHF